MRVWIVAIAMLGCGREAASPPDGTVATCGGVLPGFAEPRPAGLIARCGAIEVEVTALAGDVVHVRYAAAGEPAKTSWAIETAPELDPAATSGGDEGGRAVVCSAALVIAIDDACRVHASRPDGSVLVADAAPFAIGDAARLERTSGADHVYGLGERTGGLDRRGRAWTFWNTDAYDPAVGGWHPDQDPMYQSIPFELRLAAGGAFGVFTDVTRRMVIDFSDPARDVIAATGARAIDQYVIAGPLPADVVDRYTRLVGRPALPPRWALGFHQSRWGYANAAELEAVATQFRDLGLPADALWLDIQHYRGYRSFTFDPQAFPDPHGLVTNLAAKGFRLIAIEDPGIKIDPGWDVYDSGRAHFLDYTGTAWPGAAAFPDFSDVAARAWWADQIGHVLDQGIAGIWLDVNEPTTFPEGGGGTTVPDDIAGAGGTMAELHNVYGMLEAGATYAAIGARGERPFVLSRAGYAGIARYAAVWTGDTPSTWSGLQQTLPMLLGLGVSGVPIVGSDIGGYSGHATPELYARWLALGSISPFSRAHVTSGVPGQEPWQFGGDVTDIARDLLVDRYRLLPYLYSLADAANRTGAPILRPLFWEFPDDPAVADTGDEAMLGPSLLVAPIVEAGATSRRVYLPAGRWFDRASDAIVDGPATIDVSVRLAALPMFARAGAIIPSWPAGATGPLELDVYPGAAPSSFDVYEDDGGSIAGPSARIAITATPRSDGLDVALVRTGNLAVPTRSVTVRIHRVDGVTAATTTDGASYDADARSLAITVPDTTSRTLAFHYDLAITELAPPVATTFEVHVPATTPLDPPIAVASSATGWSHVPLAWVAPGIARGSVIAPRGAWFDFKITRGSWDTVEKRADCTELPDRSRIGAAGTRVVTVATWRDACP